MASLTNGIANSEVTQSCPTLCHPMDCSPPGSSLHGIFQARILEWVAISFSRGLPDPGIEPRSPSLQADALTSEPPGNSRKVQINSLLSTFPETSSNSVAPWYLLSVTVVDSFLGNKAATSMICKIHWQLKLCVPLTSWRADYSEGCKPRETESDSLQCGKNLLYWLPTLLLLFLKFLLFLFKRSF